MTDTPYQHMAKQFVDMWQKQLSDMLVDENFVANLIDMMHQQGVQPHAQPASSSPANSAVSPDATNAVVGQLERRIASAEGRIAELEREMAGLRRELDAQQRDAANSRQRRADTAKHKPA
jgi:TolA-binding protein